MVQDSKSSSVKNSTGLGVVVVLGLLAVGGVYLLSGTGTPPPSTGTAPDVRPANPSPAAKIPLYLFTTDNCIPCKHLHDAMQEPAVREALKRFDLMEISKRDRVKERLYKVKSYPTLVAVSPKGVSLHAGAMDAKDLAAWLNGIQ